MKYKKTSSYYVHNSNSKVGYVFVFVYSMSHDALLAPMETGCLLDMVMKWWVFFVNGCQSLKGIFFFFFTYFSSPLGGSESKVRNKTISLELRALQQG